MNTILNKISVIIFIVVMGSFSFQTQCIESDVSAKVEKPHEPQNKVSTKKINIEEVLAGTGLIVVAGAVSALAIDILREWLKNGTYNDGTAFAPAMILLSGVFATLGGQLIAEGWKGTETTESNQQS